MFTVQISQYVIRITRGHTVVTVQISQYVIYTRSHHGYSSDISIGNKITRGHTMVAVQISQYVIRLHVVTPWFQFRYLNT